MSIIVDALSAINMPGFVVHINHRKLLEAMARAAGITAVGVTWGYHAPDALREAGAHHLVDHPLEILELTKAMA